jgi:hypothetical protein
MLAADIAQGIIEREIGLGIYERVKPGPADNSIWDTENGNSIAVDMAKPVKANGKVYVKGVQWIRSDKSPGSRKHGWEKVRKYLKGGLPKTAKLQNGKEIRVPREDPGMFAFDGCTMFKELFPILPRDEDDPDDVDTDAEDHIGDEVRYRVLNAGLGREGWQDERNLTYGSEFHTPVVRGVHPRLAVAASLLRGRTRDQAARHHVPARDARTSAGRPEHEPAG